MPINKSDLTNVLLSATVKANRTYERISGGCWLNDYGVESFMAATLAVEVHEALQEWYATGHVTLEEPTYNFKDFHKCLVRKPGPRKSAMREDGRVDLALWKRGQGGDHLIGAVEAKKAWSNGEAYKDISRLRELKKNYGKVCKGELQYTAFITFLSTEKDPDGKEMGKVEKKIKAWVEDHKGEFGRMRVEFAKRRHFLEIDGSVFCGSAAVIEVV